MDPLDINRFSEQSYLLFNPALSPDKKKLIDQFDKNQFPGHIWISSSGSTSNSYIKLVGLSKKALLISAEAVNRHLKVTDKDLWLNVLPVFHVGGLGIYARAKAANIKVVDVFKEKWSTQNFVETIDSKGVTLTSLVPTQVYDLVQKGLFAPASLRAVIVGGGVLTKTLYKKAKELNWPILPSYGMTETASQIATACLDSLGKLDFPKIYLLDHAKVTINDVGEICVQATSLWSYIADISKDGTIVLQENLREQSYQTGDLGTWSAEKGLIIYGRKEAVKKISGELVVLAHLERLLEGTKGAFLFAPSERLGHQVILVLDKSEYTRRQEIINNLVRDLAPYEIPRQLYFVDEIPRTELGKIKTQKLLQTCL